MSISLNLSSYEPEWLILAEKLKRDGNATLNCGSKSAASRYRFRFYGFRKALSRHDAANPYLGVLMETQAFIYDNGDLHFERSPFAPLLRGLLEHSIIAGEPATVAASGDAESAHDRSILEIFANKEKTDGK